MTREEILAMQSGPELDRLVIENVFNARRNYHGEEEYWYHYDENGEPDYEWSCYIRPSTDISAAWEVVEKSASYSFDYSLRYAEGKWNCRIVTHKNNFFVQADTAPLAICRCALLAVMEGKDEEE